MMTSDQLKSLFENEYNREEWRNALQGIFHIKNLFAVPQSVSLGANDFNAKAVELGYFETAEGLQVGLYEVTIDPGIRLDRNKVGLRNLMRKVYQNDGDAALIIFTQGHTWRFTYASDLTIVNKETGLRERKTTDAKRYTYVLGKNRHCRTAVERFTGLKTSTDLFNENKISISEIEKAFSVETLTKQFYKELFDWYQWALSDTDGFAVTFPNDTSIATDDRKIDEHIIRLITRLMFVWFIKQKNLVPEQIFKINSLKSILKDFDPYSKVKGNYYNAILQNFFFATLNKPIDERAFAVDGDYDDLRKHYGIKSYFRNPKGSLWFKVSNDAILKLFSEVPFLNGGLFECLDKEQDSDSEIIYYDGFSREPGRQKRAFIPNCLFFDPSKGLIPLMEKYNFTIEESTPIDVEVALDPELLGKVFENLLGAFNPETKETARKQSGSFYTPREIVNYMVDESLIAYLNTKCPEIDDERTRSLFLTDNESFDFTENERSSLISALKSVKILDPACGSGAFPMGVLNKMVDLLQKLEDVEANSPYKQKLHLIENCIYGIDIQTIAVQISKLRFFITLVSNQITNSNPEDNYGITPLPNLETKFVAANTLIGLEKNFTDKLDLGYTEIRNLKDQLWDIRSQHFSARNATEKQSLRKQDENLRKEIQSLIVELTSKPDPAKIERLKVEIEALKKDKELYQGENLVELVEPSQKQGVLFDIPAKTEQLTVKIDKNKEERKRIEKLIKEKQKEIEKENNKTAISGFEDEAKHLAQWDPYDQNISSHFFDSEWMFDVKEGFDIVIGNPPYKEISDKDEKLFFQEKYRDVLSGHYDLFIFFFKKGIDLLRDNGINSYITPHTFIIYSQFENLRRWLYNNTSMLEITDRIESIFESAVVDNSISIIIKNPKGFKTRFTKYQYNGADLKQQDESILLKSNYNYEAFEINSISNKKILKKFEVNAEPLGEVVNSSQGITVYAKVQGEKINHFRERKTTKHSKPYSKGREIFKYTHQWAGGYIEYGDWLWCPRDSKYFESPKILLRQTASDIIATYIEEPFYAIDSIHSLIKKSTGPELKFILGVLNSTLGNYLYHLLIAEEGKVFAQVKLTFLRKIPIKKATDAQEKSIIKLVDKILNAKSEDAEADTNKLEKQIDELVYKLYDLTYEEVKVVDPEFWLSEHEYEKVKIE